MLFNFEKFSEIAASVYPNTPYSLEDALGVFRYYFEKYEEHTGRPHPPINASQIVRIAQNERNADPDGPAPGGRQWSSEPGPGRE